MKNVGDKDEQTELEGWDELSMELSRKHATQCVCYLSGLLQIRPRLHLLTVQPPSFSRRYNPRQQRHWQRSH